CLVGPWVMAANGQYNVLTFHGDRQRTGWIWSERILTAYRAGLTVRYGIPRNSILSPLAARPIRRTCTRRRYLSNESLSPAATLGGGRSAWSMRLRATGSCTPSARPRIVACSQSH